MNRALLFTILSGLSFSCTNYTDNISMTAEHPVLPILTMKEANPVFKIELIRHQTGDNYSLQKLEVDLHGTTDIDDIESVGLYHTDSKGMIDTNKPVLQTVSASEKVVFNTDISIDTDTFPFWVSFKLKDKVDLSHRFKASCTKIETNEGEIKVPVTASSELRAGVAVRQHKQDGVHTSRIPGLATSTKGTLLAIYDARYESPRDLQGHMDICLNRSTDGGQTWQPMQVVLDMKDWGGLPEKYNGVSDANILVDENTGIFM